MSRMHAAGGRPLEGAFRALPGGIVDFPVIVIAIIATFVMSACTEVIEVALDDASSLEIVLPHQLAAGDTVRARTQAVDSRGRRGNVKASAGGSEDGLELQWSSSDPSIVDVNGSGLVLAKRRGDADLTVSYGELEATAKVKVRGSRKGLVLAPKVDTLRMNEPLRLEAIVLDSQGDPVPDAKVSWHSEPESVATVDEMGRVTTIAAGLALVVAWSRGSADTASIAILGHPGEPDPPAVETPDDGGSGGSNDSGNDGSGGGSSGGSDGDSSGGGSGSGGSGGTGSSGASHWSHIRTQWTDFRQVSSEVAWNAKHLDVVMSGDHRAYRQTNPNIKTTAYILVFAPIIGDNSLANGAVPMEQWLTSQGCNVEAAFLHKRNQPRTAANRMRVHIWSTERYLLNPRDKCARDWIVHKITTVASGTNTDGVFVDEHTFRWYEGYFPSDEVGGAESYENAVLEFWQYVRPRVPSHIPISINTALDNANAPAVRGWIATAGDVHLEMINDPLREMAPRWDWIESLLNAGARQVEIVGALTDPEYQQMIPSYVRGNSASSGDRAKLFELASYYMVSTEDPDRTTFNPVNDWRSSLQAQWVGAVKVNVGRPVERRRKVSTGTDSTGSPIAVWRREFTNAVVVVRPIGSWDWQNTNYGDASAVWHDLPSGEKWHPVDRHGNIGSAVTRIQLRNGEAAILMKGSRL